jgi:serine protease Do
MGLSPLPFTPEQPQRRKDSADLGRPGFPDIRGLVKKVNRSVVSIRMLDSSSSWSLGNFGIQGDEPNGKALGYGAGFIISDSGHILTNEHVLRNGTRIEVELLDARKLFAKVIQKDNKNDLALLKIDAPREVLQPVDMGNSDDVELGEWVVGIGNPYGIGQSLMIGIVSAKTRKIPGSGYPPLIQIDAAMNLGNSGGPLFNLEGKVVGINTILLWKSQGIGFATPINVAKEFLSPKGRPIARSAVTSEPSAPFGPASDVRNPSGDTFNPLAPPWKYGR